MQKRTESGTLGLLAGALVAILALVGCHRSAAPEGKGPATVHSYAAGPGGVFANAYLVETRDGVVVVDGGLTVSDGKAIRARLDALGKPLLAVLLTHGHPDHYNGVTFIVGDSGAPVFATAGVDKVIRTDDAAKEQQWSGMFGAEWPKQRTFPTRVVSSGETLTFGNVRFTVEELGAGESHADAWWLMEARDGSEAFIGDVVLNGVHAYVTDGHTTEWLANLEALRPKLQGVRAVHPGHGPSGDASMLDWQKAYLVEYRRAVQEIGGGSASLSDAQKQALVQRMKAFLPTDKMEFLIGMGADSVARELSSGAAAR